ncbi:MAG: OmpA family protein [Porticoccaceae bacterium]|nr:OmpA family protein [Porticoccaceae bacterium]
MKLINTVVGVVAFAIAGASLANDQWYLGATAGHYDLDSNRAVVDDHKSATLGLQIGKYIADDVAIELGYGANSGHDEVNVTSLNALVWLGDSSSSWRPYLLGGFNQYDFDDTNNLMPGHDDKSEQVLLGLGLGTQFEGALEFRADIRGMADLDDTNAQDYGFQLSLNKLFGKKAAPAPAPAPVAPAPVAEPEPAAEPEVRTITVRLNVEFEFNQDTVLAIYGDQLEAIAAAMKAHEDIDLVLEGHTDSRGSDDYNMSLSDRRAKAVKAKLVADYGIPAERVSAMGYGETQPVASNETDEGRARNRRVVGEMSFSEVYSF